MSLATRPYKVKLLDYCLSDYVTTPDVGSEVEITLDHSLSCSDRDAYLRAEHAAINAARQFFPDGLPEDATFRVEHYGLVLEVDLEMIPQYRARKPRT
jgi:hypothetical protein